MNTKPWANGSAAAHVLLHAVVACLAVALLASDPASAQGSAAATPQQAREIEAPGSPGRPQACQLTPRFRTLDDLTKPLTAWSQLTGDWNGVRCRLHERGIIPKLSYTVELMSKLQGGATNDVVARVLGNLDLNLTIQTEPLFGWPGGSFFFHFENLVGQTDGVNPAVGFPFNVVSTLNAEDSFARMMSYYYRQVAFDGRLGFKLGKQDAVADFLASETLGNYLNLGDNPPGNIPMPTWPFPELGLAVFAKPFEMLELSAGVYGGDLTGKSFSAAGLFSGDVFAIAQIDLQPDVAGRPGSLQLGAWLATTDNPALDGSKVFDSNYGPYFLFDQELLRDAGPERSVHAWLQFTWTPPDRNENSWWLGGGVVWEGAFPAVAGDSAGFGIYHAHASPDTPGESGETTIELFYKVPLTPWLILQPDVQYFVNPASDGRNALVAGVRAVVHF